MRLVTFRSCTGEHLGALLPAMSGSVLDLAHAGRLLYRNEVPAFASMQALIEAGEQGLEHAEACLRALPAEAVVADGWRYAPPLPRPIRARDCTLFINHLEDAGRAMARREASTAQNPKAEYERLIASGRYDLPPLLREQPVYYNCDRLTFSAHEEEIWWPPTSTWMDYELEWACVVGVTASELRPENAGRAIFGYTIFNDWTARDLQLRGLKGPFGVAEGKDFDGGNTIGPAIVTRDEVPNPYNLTLIARVNGEEWSRGSTSTMHHTFEDAVVHLSRGRKVWAGELLASGTVRTGTGLDQDKRLSDGDIVEIEVERVGLLRNRVRVTGKEGA